MLLIRLNTFFQINDMIFKEISKKLNYNVNWKQIVIQE